MLRLVTRLALLASVIYSSNAYTLCNQIQFCQNYRQQNLDQNHAYWADIGSISTENKVAKIQLKNNQNEQLTLEISFLENNKARMKIGSNNYKRYELVDVLVEEPKTVELEIKDKSDNSVTLSPSDTQSIKLIVRKGAPFSIESYYNNEIESIIDGSRFHMENTDNDESFHFNIIFPKSEVLYGLHHHATKLVLMETGDGSHEPYRLKNSDVYGFQVGSTEALYGAVPVIWGHSPSRTSGVFLQNAAQQWVDITYKNQRGPSAHFMVESAAFDLFIMFGPTPKETLKQYTDLTGKAHMPQLWTLGYHQSRNSYKTQEEVMSTIYQMDKYNFTMDAIWLDVDYSDGKRYFIFHPFNFWDPEGMQRTIGSTNRKLVTIIDPHIKTENGYHVYDGARGKYFVKDSSGNNDFQGYCLPGLSSWIDFLNPEARAYWASQYSYKNFQHQTPFLAGTWNDMNEPTVYKAAGSENSLPGDSRHYGNVTHRDIHNAYGFLNSMASHEGMLKRDDGKFRPFVLSRSHFAGSQRYAAMWTGHSISNVEYLPIVYSECLLSGIMGHVFCGSDIGGFAGHPSDNLLQRWYQASMWLPFFRSHANSNTLHREPYYFKDDVRSVIRKAIQIRYRHLQVLYTLFYLHSKTGEPVSRPLFYEYPEMMDQDDHLLLGTDILATPVLKEYTEDVQAHFPGNSSTLWYRADNGQWNVYRGGNQAEIHADINTSPYFYRGGSIIVTKDNVKRSSTDMKDDPFTVYINYDPNGKAEGLVYNDDHTSFDYQNGEYYLIKMEGYGNQVQMNKLEGNMNVDFKIDRVITHRLSAEDPTKVVETVQTTTADGTQLINLDFNLLRSSGDNSSYTFYL